MERRREPTPGRQPVNWELHTLEQGNPASDYHGFPEWQQEMAEKQQEPTEPPVNDLTEQDI